MKHGTVTYSNCTETGSVYVSVTVARTQVTYEKVPVVQSFGGEAQSIEEGVQVVLDKCDDGMWVVIGVLGRDSERLHSVEDQERVLSFDDGTEFAVSRDGNGGYDVSITASGAVSTESTGDTSTTSGGSVTTSADGSVSTDAGGDVTTTSQGNVSVDATGNASVTPDGDMDIDAGTNVSISSDGYISIQSGGDAVIDGSGDVRLAPNSANYVISGADIEVDGTGGGFYLTGMDGERYRVYVNSSGELVTDGPL